MARPSTARAAPAAAAGAVVPPSGMPYRDMSIATTLLTEDEEEWSRKTEREKALLANSVRTAAIAAKNNTGPAGANKKDTIVASKSGGQKIFCWESPDCYRWLADSEETVYQTLLKDEALQPAEKVAIRDKSFVLWSSYISRFNPQFKAVPAKGFLTYVCAIKAKNPGQSWLDCTYQAMSYMSEANPAQATTYLGLATYTRTMVLFFPDSDKKLLEILHIPADGARTHFVYIVAACYRLLTVLIAGHYLVGEWVEYLQVIAITPPDEPTLIDALPSKLPEARNVHFPVKAVKYHCQDTEIQRFDFTVQANQESKFTTLEQIQTQVLANISSRRAVTGIRGAFDSVLLDSLKNSIEFNGTYESITANLASGEKISVDLRKVGAGRALSDDQLQAYNRIFAALRNYSKANRQNATETGMFVKEDIFEHLTKLISWDITLPTGELISDWVPLAIRLSDNARMLFEDLNITEENAMSARPGYSQSKQKRGVMNVADLLRSLDDD